MSRLPIRLKVTVALGLLLSVTLAGFGLGVYLHTKSSLDHVIRRDLVDRAAAIAAAARGSGAVPPHDRIAQIISPDGRVAAGHPSRPALTRAEIERARRHPFFVDRTEATRLYARPGPRGTVVVDGISLHQREHALESLAAALLIGGPLAVLVAGCLAYLLTRAALRPVDEMRARAEAASDPTARLPVPRANDELRRLSETLNELLARVQRAIEHERAFLGNASHQLRTPLALLRAELDLARTLAATPPEVRVALDHAIADTDRLAGMVSDLLLLARADEGALPAELEPLDLAQVASAVAARHELRVPAGAPVLAVGDRQLTEQVLENLIENGLRHGAGAVEVTVEARGEEAAVVVADAGPGFPEAFLPHAFDRFAQADSSAGGVGLGLAVAQALAARQGGTVTLRNREAGGAEAVLSLRTASLAAAVRRSRGTPGTPPRTRG